MKMRIKNIIPILLAAMLLPGCGGSTESKLSASGTIEAISVNIAPEVGGVVHQVMANEGDEVNAGDTLFIMDSELLQSQLEQAATAEIGAEATLATAKEIYAIAELQYQLTVKNSRTQYNQALLNEWREKQPSNFDLPVWYFTRNERVEAAEALVESAKEELIKQKEIFESVLKNVKNADFIDIEKELSQAQTEYLVADTAQDYISKAQERKEMEDAAKDAFELKKNQLENIQKRYDQALDSQAAKDILKARADVGLAQTTYDEAVNFLNSLSIGDDSLEVKIAEKTVKQANKNIAQAEAGLKQAQAALQTIQIQLDKTIVKSPITGVVFSQNLEKGEMVNSGGVVMTIGNLDEVSLTVFIPEDRFGQVRMGQEAVVSVDSFPEKTYLGSVSNIANKAEFTPSNVQTVEGRKATVFAIKITIPNPNHDLKPGMPADIEFISQFSE